MKGAGARREERGKEAEGMGGDSKGSSWWPNH